MARRHRTTTSLALLAAALLLGGAAWLLLREDGGSGGGSGREATAAAPRAADAGSGSGAPAAPAPEDAPAPDSGAGLVTGTLVLPRAEGRPPVEARLAVLREGAVVAEATTGAGAFSLAYARPAGDPGPWRLRAAAAGRTPVEVALPSPSSDAGEIRLYAGIVYSGVAVDERGLPQPGVTMHLIVDGVEAAASEPCSPDGGFRIPVPPYTRLQGLFQEEPDKPWVTLPSLEPRAPGRLFVETPASAEGLTGVHRVVLEERPVGIRLRFLEGEAAAPVVGAAVSLWASPDLFSLVPPAPADTGTTDGEGIYAPRWPMALQWAAIRVVLPGGRVRWTLLDRAYAEGTEPRDLLIPAEPRALRGICLRGQGTEPVAGALVVLVTNAGFSFWGTSGADGGLAFAFFESDCFDPEPLAVSAWTASWNDGKEGLRLEAGGTAAAGQADFREIDWTVDAPEPYPVRLGGEEANGIWIALSGGAGTERPAMLTANLAGVDPAKEGWRILLSAFKGPATGGNWRRLWWTYDYSRDIFRRNPGPFGGKPPETPLSVQLRTVNGPAVDATIPLAALVAARGSRNALVFDLAPAEAMTRTVRVVDARGNPRPGALVAVLVQDQPRPWPSRETERLASDDAGRAVLQTLDPAGKSSVLAWDPSDGSCGILVGLREEAPEAAWTLRLEPPREFRVAVRMADGSAMTSCHGHLQPLSGMMPPIVLDFAGGTEASARDVAVAGYSLYVYGWTGKGSIRARSVDAASVAGGEVVLGEATPASGR